MHRITTLALTTMALLCLAAAVPAGDAFAQQTQHVSYKVGAENSKYTQQQFLDVGDIADHQVRSFEIHRSFPSNAPVINGMKIKEQWTRGICDYVDNNGTARLHSVSPAQPAKASVRARCTPMPQRHSASVPRPAVHEPTSAIR